jgi:carbon storage regulator
MLVLSRKVGETIVIDGRISVKLLRVDGDSVRIGIEAPANVPVHRKEVYDEIQKNNQEAVTRQGVPVPKLARRGGVTAPQQQPSTQGNAA